MTKILPYLLPSVFICLIFVAWQEFDNAVREDNAKALFSEAKDGPEEEFELRTLEAIEQLEYRNILGHNVIVDAYLKAYYFYNLVFHLDDTEKRSLYARKAMEYFTVAVKQRPTLAVTWSYLAQLAWVLGLQDNNFYHYLEQAHRLGLYEFQTHSRLVTIGVWMIEQNHPIPEVTKSILIHHVIYGLNDKKSRSIISSLIKANKTTKDTFCSWLDSHTDVFKKISC